MGESQQIPCIYVLAGTNGAGKSSLAGAMIEQEGGEYFNPDKAALQIRAANPGVSLDQANAEAWQEGTRLLKRAIAERRSFAFETTLGGTTIAGLLQEALAQGMEVRIWYAGLKSPELHIDRVAARVKQGGHDIPESKIRDRYDKSRLNLIRLLPTLTELRLYDNSDEGDPHAGIRPKPQLLLHIEHGKIQESCEPAVVPQWAKAILAAAIKIDPGDRD